MNPGLNYAAKNLLATIFFGERLVIHGNCVIYGKCVISFFLHQSFPFLWRSNRLSYGFNAVIFMLSTRKWRFNPPLKCFKFN